MSGNPFGLSEISHFGSFQRVGGKAGGFINKKFFHPSSIRNQEKLWKAQTADERERKKQNELEKRREEERQVEDMRKQLYLAGQGKASDMFVQSSKEDVGKATSEDKDQRDAVREEKRRKALVKAAGEDDSDDDMPAAYGERVLLRSRYKEDKFESGHTAIWGSWYSKGDSRWGFGCCKVLSRGTECPLAPEEEPPAALAAQQEKARSKRKRRGEAEDERGDDAAPASSGANPAGEETGGLQSSGRAAAPQSSRIGGDGDESLMDMRMLEAAERRRQKKREEEQRKEEAKKSGYLNNLLHNPAAEPQA